MAQNKNNKPLTAEEKIIQSLESFADALQRGDDVTEKFTCRKVVLDLQPITYTAEMVQAARRRLGVSQALFAQFLGVSKSALRAWEQGTREPSPMACRFLDEIMSDPDGFRQRFVRLIKPATQVQSC